jgi:hypothetical protein
LKVCDVHHDRKAVDTIHIASEDTRVDVCDECKYAVLALLSKPAEQPIEEPVKKTLVQKVFGKS